MNAEHVTMTGSCHTNQRAAVEAVTLGNGGLTRMQLQWAASHDWFIRSSCDTAVVRDADDGSELRFDNFPALRRWAGY